jgi:hypothetical protein
MQVSHAKSNLQVSASKELRGRRQQDAKEPSMLTSVPSLRIKVNVLREHPAAEDAPASFETTNDKKFPPMQVSMHHCFWAELLITTLKHFQIQQQVACYPCSTAASPGMCKR